MLFKIVKMEKHRSVTGPAGKPKMFKYNLTGVAIASFKNRRWQSQTLRL